MADQVVLIDISPQELIKRLKEGKVYLGDKATRAEDNFFKEAYLTALREISLRFTAEKVDHDLKDHLSIQQIDSPWNTNERLIVAVSHSPHSAKLIRAARRMAFNLEAPWIAIHIDNGTQLNPTDQQTLLKNMSLARELGAEVISLYDTDFATALNRIAIEKNATQIILGRPERYTFRALLNTLIKQTHFVDIHIIRQEKDTNTDAKKIKNSVKNFAGTGPVPYLYTIYYLFLVTLLCAFITPYIGYRAVGYIYMMAVIGVGFRSTMGPILFSAISSAALWNYFFIPPIFTFSIKETEDKMMCVAFIFIGILAGYLARKTRNKEKLLIRREEKSRVLFNLLKDFSTAMDAKTICNLATKSIQELLDSEVKILLVDDNKLSRVTTIGEDIFEKEYALAHWSFDNKKIAGWSTETLSQSNCLSLPITAPDRILGILLFYPSTYQQKITIDEDILLNSICFQLGNALEHILLQEQTQSINLFKESEKLHQTLLNSVSHEMRIPLTAIMGSVSALQDKNIQNDQEKISILNQSILDSSNRLNRVIENLLNMNRLDSGLLTLKKEWIEVADLVQSVISQIKIKNKSITIIELTPKVYLNCDEALLEHALMNLLLNAITYSKINSIIKVEIEVVDNKIEIRVLDQGIGIPDDKLQFIFDKFYRLPGSPTGGVGLGLSIVKGITEAHNGHVFVHNRQDEPGAIFTIELPWEKPPMNLVEAQG